MPVPRRRTKAVERVSPPPVPVGAFYIKLVVAGIFIVGGSFYIGTRDSGQISVSAVMGEATQVDENGQVIQGGEGGNTAGISDALRSMPNGGLVPQDGSATPPPPPPAPEETGTTTLAEGEETLDGEGEATSETSEQDEVEGEETSTETSEPSV